MTVTAPQVESALYDALARVWAMTRGEPSVSVALIDGPVDWSHESLHAASITELINAAPEPLPEAVRHGTHVASIIFGQHGGPVRGIAPGCRGLVVPLFTTDVDGAGAPVATQRELAEAIRAATRAGADVINVSAGEWMEGSAIDPVLAEVIDESVAHGVIVVAAAGPGGCARPQVPASLPDVLAVAVDEPSAPAQSGCLLAPGVEIAGAVPGGGIAHESGSSYACAIVSGVAALLLSLCPDPGRVLDSLHRAGPRLNVEGALLYLLDSGDESNPLGERTWRVAQGALTDKFRGVAEADFGTVTVTLTSGRAYRVADFHYAVERGRQGMRLVPVSDGGPPGSAVLDAVLRREMGLTAGDDLYALLSYIHPDEHAYDAEALPLTSKLQLSHRHVGAYLGDGRTTQALLQPEHWRGEDAGHMALNADFHPANVQIVMLDGVPQAVLNRNARIVDAIMINSARIPRGADDLIHCRTVELTSTLMYYRDLLRGSEYLEELAWYTSCALHKAIVVNVFLNLPHNPGAFAETFGDDGANVWGHFTRRFEQTNGRPFTAADETDFTPLWKRTGLCANAIRPLALGEYHAFYAAHAEDRLDRFTGRRPLDTSEGLAWPLETLAGLLNRYVDFYFPFELAGGVAAAAAWLAMGDPVSRRTGIDPCVYFEAISPMLAKLLAAEAMTRGSLGLAWLASTARELEWSSSRGHTVAPLMRDVIERNVELAARLHTAAGNRAPIGRPIASAWLREVLREDLSALDALVLAKRGGRTGHFASPSIFHELAAGRHPCSPYVRVRSVCTVMDVGDLVPTV